jgi:predicted nucleic acid-binding protein
VIYLDTSVLLATLLGEDKFPRESFWNQRLVASRLLQYETWNRLHAGRLGNSHGEAARSYLNRISFLELSPPVLERALEPFPCAVRTLDTLHLASALFVKKMDDGLELATYDERMAAAARKLNISLSDL